MKKQLFLIIITYIACIQHIQAQWTKEDSVELQNILSGKKKVELNPETVKAIRAGALLNQEEAASNLKINEHPLPILKDFTEYLKKDSIHRKINLTDLPPAVFLLYGPPSLPELKLYLSIKQEIEAISHTFRRPSGVGFGEIFSRKIRIHKRNAKRDDTWKDYSGISSREVIEKREKFLTEHPEYNIRDTISKGKTSYR